MEPDLARSDFAPRFEPWELPLACVVFDALCWKGSVVLERAGGLEVLAPGPSALQGVRPSRRGGKLLMNASTVNTANLDGIPSK